MRVFVVFIEISTNILFCFNISLDRGMEITEPIVFCEIELLFRAFMATAFNMDD